jgi:hypothetical protein
MELPGMDEESASLLTSEQQQRFQMLLPMFQQFLQQGSPFGDPFGGGDGGGGGGGAPPASKAVVESLERLTLDASNLREVTMRSVVRVFEQMPDDERKERKEDESAETSPPPPLELVCEPASFGPEIHQHELLSHGGVSSSVPVPIRLCLAEPVELNVTPSNSSAMKCVHDFFFICYYSFFIHFLFIFYFIFPSFFRHFFFFFFDISFCFYFFFVLLLITTTQRCRCRLSSW